MTPQAKTTLFITTDAVGGVWRYSLALARGLADEGRGCTLAVLGPAADAAQRAEADAIPGCRLLQTGLALEWLLKSRAELDRLIQDLARLARRSGAAATHLHAPALAANGWPQPVVAVAHSCMATWWDAVHGGAAPAAIAWHAEATRQGLLRVDAAIAPSAAFAQALARVYDLGRPVTVVYNGLPDATGSALDRAGYVFTAGRLWDEAKNVAVLDAAAARMRVAVRAAGALCTPVGSAVRFDHIEPLGTLSADATRAAMASACIFASPARYEPFGLAVLEAALLATPLVLSDIPTFRELWDGAATFVAAQDAQAWATALDGLAQDKARRVQLGLAARERARRYTQAGMVSATVAIHDGIGARRSRAA